MKQCLYNGYTYVFLQINMLLNFKDDKQECPCPEYIREQLLDFHEDLMRHCGKVPFSFIHKANQTFIIWHALCTDFSILSGIELDEERGIDCDSDFTIRGRLMSLVEKVAYLKKKMANLPKEKKDRKPSKSSAAADKQQCGKFLHLKTVVCKFRFLMYKSFE